MGADRELSAAFSLPGNTLTWQFIMVRSIRGKKFLLSNEEIFLSETLLNSHTGIRFPSLCIGKLVLRLEGWEQEIFISCEESIHSHPELFPHRMQPATGNKGTKTNLGAIKFATLS